MDRQQLGSASIPCDILSRLKCLGGVGGVGGKCGKRGKSASPPALRLDLEKGANTAEKVTARLARYRQPSVAAHSAPRGAKH